MRSKPKTACKPSKVINVHIPVLKTLNDPTQVSRLFEINGSAWWPLESKRNRNPNRKIQTPHRRSNAKKRKNPQATMNNQSKKSNFFGTKTDLKKKPKIPMPPSRMNRSVKSTCVDCIRIPTNDNTATNIISETSTKTFFFLHQKHAAKQL